MRLSLARIRPPPRRRDGPGPPSTVGCRKEDMSDQPKFYHPYHQTERSSPTARPPARSPTGTIARGHLRTAEGPVHRQACTTPSLQARTSTSTTSRSTITHDDLVRGQQKYNIYCAVCHGAVGDGAGMIVTRGMIRPPSFVRSRPLPTARLTDREVNVQRAPIGHYFDVITNGYGAMYSYNDRVGVEDRWRIAAYIKALQVSQDADLKHRHLPPAAQQRGHRFRCRPTRRAAQQRSPGRPRPGRPTTAAAGSAGTGTVQPSAAKRPPVTQPMRQPGRGRRPAAQATLTADQEPNRCPNIHTLDYAGPLPAAVRRSMPHPVVSLRNARAAGRRHRAGLLVATTLLGRHERDAGVPRPAVRVPLLDGTDAGRDGVRRHQPHDRRRVGRRLPPVRRGGVPGHRCRGCWSSACSSPCPGYQPPVPLGPPGRRSSLRRLARGVPT